MAVPCYRLPTQILRRFDRTGERVISRCLTKSSDENIFHLLQFPSTIDRATFAPNGLKPLGLRLHPKRADRLPTGLEFGFRENFRFCPRTSSVIIR